MKAMPVRMGDNCSYILCKIDECTHIHLYIPGPSRRITIPVVLGDISKFSSQLWQWNGSIDKPTIRPSLMTKGEDADGKFKCHSYVTDGNVKFLTDSTHEFAGKTIALIDIAA